MNKSVKTVSGLVIAALVCFSVTLKSQTNEEAIDAYNAGINLTSTNVNEAIASFEKCMNICDQIGEDATETRVKAEQALPSLYFKSSISLYNEAKKINKEKKMNEAKEMDELKKMDEAIAQMQKSLELATKCKNEQVREKAKKTVPKFYNSKAIMAAQGGKLDDAIASYKKAIELNLTYAQAYFGLGMAYKKQKNAVKMEENLNKAIEAGSENNIKTAKKAKKVLAQSNAKKGVNAIKNKNYDSALEAFIKSLEYDEKNSDSYYYIAFVQNEKKNWDSAIEAANKSLELSNGKSDNDKAKIYYELGKSYAAKGDNTSACEAYKNASYGKYAKNAVYQLNEVLKCN